MIVALFYYVRKIGEEKKEFIRVAINTRRAIERNVSKQTQLVDNLLEALNKLPQNKSAINIDRFKSRMRQMRGSSITTSDELSRGSKTFGRSGRT
jgi:hypothetical protein